MAADLVIVNAKIVTVNREFAIAEATAIKGETIVAVGRAADVMKLVGPSTEVLNAQGNTVIPGLIDSHIHMLSTGATLLILNCRTPPMKSITDIVKAAQDQVKKSKPREWIQGRGWDQSKLVEKRFPTRWDLDKVSLDNPVYLVRTCGHLAVVNSAALRVAGITRDTSQPVGGMIEKDKRGEPTGVLMEAPAMSLVSQHIPARTFEEKTKAIREASKRFNEAGLTGVIEAGISPEDMRAYQRCLEDGSLNVRVNMMLSAPDRSKTVEECESQIQAFPFYTGFGNKMLRISGLKILIDGGVGGRTALLNEPYTNDTENVGLLTLPEHRLRALVDLANKYDWQVGVHCAGDRAMDITLNAFEETHRKKSIKGKRWTIIHSYLPSEKNFQQCREMGVVVASQPSFLYYLGDSYYENLGQNRAFYAKPHKDWLKQGIVVASGTDSPVTPYLPFVSLWASIARKTEVSGTQLGTEQAVTREEALRMYTINGAYLSFEEKVKGSVEPGKLADLLIIDRDILTCPVDHIKDTRVLRTILGGRTVYKA